jgi:undecaprenyl diphosphate synthase
MTADPGDNQIPTHVAIIPDGNRRWGKQRGLTAQQAHKIGYENFLSLVDAGFERGLKHITAYMFSTENWNRSKDEVGFLMKLAGMIVVDQGKRFNKDGRQIRFLGSRRGLDEKLANQLDELEELTKNNSNGNLNICFNYGGRLDITEAVQKLITAGVKAEDVNETVIAEYLSTTGIPDPDLIIRTSGEKRLSNFLAWEGAYSELYFAECMWPDFDESELDNALADYAKRKRNFGV